jgi:hypothetical protein
MAHDRASVARNAFARVGTAPPPADADAMLPAVVQPTAVLSAPPAVPRTGPLSESEHADLAAYEAAYEAACDEGRRAAFAAGQALKFIRDAGLYREQYTSFEAYTRERWDLAHSQAYRLIDAWELGRRLSPIGERFGVRVTESHIRELLPLARKEGLGPDAAEAVYVAAAESGGRITAKVLRRQSQARLTGGDAPEPVNPARALSASVLAKIYRFASTTADRDAVDLTLELVSAGLVELKRQIQAEREAGQ